MVDDRIKMGLIAFAIGAVFVLWSAIAFHIGRKHPLKLDSPAISVRVDTLLVRDTIREKYPVYLTKYVDRVELVPVTDTIRRTDTLFMAVEIEKKTYQGKDYRAVVSGWHPSLDEIAVYPKTVYLQPTVTETAPRKRVRMGFGATAGPAVIWTPDSGVKAGAGVAAGFTLCF